jgi:hypothetical protein
MGVGVDGVVGSGKVSELPLIGNNVLDLINMQGGAAKPEREKAEKDTKALVDKYRAQSQEGKRAGILPIQLSFPAFGPSVFLVSELTAENQPPTIDITYEAAKKGGAR